MNGSRKCYIEKEDVQDNCLEILNIIIWKCHMVPSIAHAKKSLFKKYIKGIIHRNQVSFSLGMQGWFNMCKSTNAIHYIISFKCRNDVIISIDKEKAFIKFEHDKFLKKIKHGTYLKII